MNEAASRFDPCIGGIHIHGATAHDIESTQRGFLAQLANLGLEQVVTITNEPGGDRPSIGFRLREEFANEWAPNSNTMQLCQKLSFDTRCNPGDLEREILLAMLLSPVPFQFPSYDELVSAIRIRKNIVEAARRTTLAFRTNEAERPADYWVYTEGCGFTLLPGKSLITALRKACQPGISDQLYSFSCYRATEYVILLGIAQELMICNPELLNRLQQLWETRSIMSGEFHEVFLREYGTMDEPLPEKYYVPGDRVWFRNPDEYSADVTGYEGSWVIYLGDGLFTNFWQRGKTYTLSSKCLELFHWRNATCRNQVDELQIDETIVEKLVEISMGNPAEIEQILSIMLRFREPKGVYANGGCIDTSREYPRWVCPGTCDLVLPDR